MKHMKQAHGGTGSVALKLLPDLSNFIIFTRSKWCHFVLCYQWPRLVLLSSLSIYQT